MKLLRRILLFFKRPTRVLIVTHWEDKQWGNCLVVLDSDGQMWYMDSNLGMNVQWKKISSPVFNNDVKSLRGNLN